MRTLPLFGLALMGALLQAAPGRTTLQPADLSGSSFFGFATASSGSYLAVGAPLLNGNNGFGQGAVYIYQRAGGNSWVFQSKIQLPVADFNDDFGISLAMEGNVLMVGAPLAFGGVGVALEYQLINGVWAHQLTLTGEPGDIHFGHNVSMNRGTLAVGSGALNTASVYVYNRDAKANVWQAPLRIRSNGNSSTMGFGYALEVRGDAMVIGAPYAGLAYVYGRRNGGWSQDTVLTPPAGYADAFFGWSVALDKGRVAVGAPLGMLGGAVFVYNQGTGAALFNVTPGAVGASIFGNFGLAVAMVGDQLAIGAPNYAPGTVSLLLVNGTTWTQTAQYTADAGGFEAAFGRTILLPDNNTVMVSSPSWSSGTVQYLGAVDVFTK